MEVRGERGSKGHGEHGRHGIGMALAWPCRAMARGEMLGQGLEGTRGQGRSRVCSNLGQTLFEIVNLVLFDSFPPSVRHNGRKKKIFKILNEIWWSCFI